MLFMSVFRDFYREIRAELTELSIKERKRHQSKAGIWLW
ncbi:hypothetical protein PTUN_a4228 [Pseudoalteromonas tunicata]|nr:hypothetical protein PTUN_a4228 [Pseudoalteromonas tunicata]